MDNLLQRQPLEYEEFARYYLNLVKLSKVYITDVEIAYNSYISKYYSSYSCKLRELAQ